MSATPAPLSRRPAGSTKVLTPRQAAARAGIPRTPGPDQPWPRRVVGSRLFWLSVVMLGVYATLLVLLYQQVVPDQDVPGGRVLGLGTEAVPIAARYAAITAIPLSLLFLWADRFRPQRFWVWLMTFGWGACVATYVAAQVNTWAAGHLSIVGNGDPATGARAAIYVAPFVEEACKGTVLFWLVILMRYQWVSRLSGIVLAGLSGAAFAFVENILYYGRAYRYAAQTFGEVEPIQALQQLFVLRGGLTFFGHPLFTSMIGIGLAVAVRSKSKIVRVVAPLTGYCAAVFLHMLFNATSSFASGRSLLLIYLLVAVPLVLGMVGFIVRQLFREGRIIHERLSDYARLGWLPETDPEPMSRLRTRAKALWHALFQGLPVAWATVRMQRSLTELAYLRDSMAVGIVDQAGLAREKELLATARSLRGEAVIAPEGRAPYPAFRRPGFLGRTKTAIGYAPPTYPGPAGIGGSYPAPAASGHPGARPPMSAAPGTAPLGQAATEYSEVDPTWAPPPGR
ncbi:MAG: PrsW family intramembrane metalloprotease [Propionibacteriaceae bacterium]